MEARIARLESDVAHMRTDVAEIKLDLRGLRDKMDLLGAEVSKNTLKLTETKASIENSIASAKAETKANLKSSIASAKIWVLLFLIGYGTAILAAMARGFGWI